MNEIKQLPQDQKDILKQMILDHPNRPEKFKFSRVFSKFDYRKHTEETIRSALNKLVDAGFFVKDDTDSYIFTRDSFIQTKTYYKIRIFLHDGEKIMVLVTSIIIAASLTIGLTKLPKRFISRKITTEENNVKTQGTLDSIDYRLLQLESFVERVTKISKSSKITLELEDLRNQISKIETTTNSLFRAMGNDPSKLIELSSLQSEIEHLKSKQKNNYDSINRELTRISSYNTTIIIFMITFMVALFGLGLLNILRQKKT